MRWCSNRSCKKCPMNRETGWPTWLVPQEFCDTSYCLSHSPLRVAFPRVFAVPLISARTSHLLPFDSTFVLVAVISPISFLSCVLSTCCFCEALVLPAPLGCVLWAFPSSAQGQWRSGAVSAQSARKAVCVCRWQGTSVPLVVVCRFRKLEAFSVFSRKSEYRQIHLRPVQYM